MNYTGSIFYNKGDAKPYVTLKGAKVTPHRISLDWEEGGDIGHLVLEAANAKDIFEGQCTYRPSGEVYKCSMRLYRSHERLLLFGTFHPCENYPGTEEGSWVFTL